MIKTTDPANSLVEISIADQRLRMSRDGEVRMDCSIATARNGPGEVMDSECTPRGWHQVRARIGDGCPVNTIFVGRRPTGEIYRPEMRSRYPGRDWILTRILWLCGQEPGRNRFGRVDTMRRYIYIHGCPDDDPMGIPSSHGCIKMRNHEVIRLFDEIPAGTPVRIHECPL
mgnify:FL=1